MEHGMIALSPREYREWYARGCIIFLPMVRCPECKGSGEMEEGVRCAHCLYSALPGWLPVEPTEEIQPIMARRNRYVSRKEIVSSLGRGGSPAVPSGAKTG